MKTVTILNEEDLTKKTIMDYLLFFLSAAIISAILYGFFFANQFNWTLVSGYLLALFWILTTWGYRGLIKGHIQYTTYLEKIIVEEIKKSNDQSQPPNPS